MPIRSWFGRYYAKKYFLILVSYESRTKNHNIHVLDIYFCFVAFEIGRPARWRLWNIQKPDGEWVGGERCGWPTVAKGLWNVGKHHFWLSLARFSKFRFPKFGVVWFCYCNIFPIDFCYKNLKGGAANTLLYLVDFSYQKTYIWYTLTWIKVIHPKFREIM